MSSQETIPIVNSSLPAAPAVATSTPVKAAGEFVVPEVDGVVTIAPNAVYFVDGYVVRVTKYKKCIRVIDLDNLGTEYLPTGAADNLKSNYDLIDWASVLKSHDKCDGIECSSAALFEFADTEEIEVFQTEHGWKRVTAQIRKNNSKKVWKTIEVVPLKPKHFQRKFLYLPESQFGNAMNVSGENNLVTEGNLLFRYHKLDVHALPFTETDLELLWSFTSKKPGYYDICSEMFQVVFPYVQNNVISRRLVPSFVGGFESNEVFPKKLRTATIDFYKGYGAVIFFLIDVSKNLSIFQNMNLPSSFQFPVLSSDATASARSISVFFYRFFNDEEGTMSVWECLFRLACLDWSKPNNGVPTSVSLDQYRHLLDSFRQIVINFTLFNHCNNAPVVDRLVDIFTVEHKRNQAWKHFSDLYHTVLTEIDQQPGCVRPLGEYACTVKGKRFDVNYVRLFYKEIVGHFDSLVSKLETYCVGLHSVNSVMSSIKQSAVSRPADDPSNTHMNLIQVFQSIFDQIQPTSFVDSPDYSAIYTLINDLSACTAWLVYFSGTGPYRFPDLMMLRVGGPMRNVFFNKHSGCVELFTTYSKTRILKPIMKKLDSFTSKYVLYYCLVIKCIQANAFLNNGRTFAGENGLLMESRPELLSQSNVVVEGPSLDEPGYVRLVCNVMMFVDSFNDSTLEYNVFKKLYKKTPSTLHPFDRLTFQEMRHGMIYLLRKVAKGVDNSNILVAAELLAGHSALVGRSVYGVNEFNRHSASVEADVSAEILKKWHAFVDFEHVHGYDSNIMVVPNQPQIYTHRFEVNGSSNILFNCAEDLYGSGFRFRDHQLTICMDILFTSTPVLAVQALPGWGKTLLYQLPLLALKAHGREKYVSFVFTPYSVLMAGTSLRLSEGNVLSVGSVGSLIHQHGTLKDEEIKDVYVGNFNDLGNEAFSHMFNCWNDRRPGLAIGLMVMDEFHNFETEWEYRGNSFKSIGKVNFGMARKLVVITGTAGKDGFSKSFDRIGHKIKLTSDMRTSDDATYIHNLVEDVPLKHVVKFEETHETVNQCFDKALNLLRAFKLARPSSKAIVICGGLDDARNLAESCPDSTLIFGDMEPSEKIAAASSFINDAGKTVLVGTCLVGEGIDISTVELVIMLRYTHNIAAYIQAAGRIRVAGVCWSLSTVPVAESCLSSEMATFYDLSSNGHFGCCGNYDNSPQSAQELFNILQNAESVTSSPATPCADVVGDASLSKRPPPGNDTIVFSANKKHRSNNTESANYTITQLIPISPAAPTNQNHFSDNVENDATPYDDPIVGEPSVQVPATSSQGRIVAAQQHYPTINSPHIIRSDDSIVQTSPHQSNTGTTNTTSSPSPVDDLSFSEADYNMLCNSTQPPVAKDLSKATSQPSTREMESSSVNTDSSIAESSSQVAAYERHQKRTAQQSTNLSNGIPISRIFDMKVRNAPLKNPRKVDSLTVTSAATRLRHRQNVGRLDQFRYNPNRSNISTSSRSSSSSVYNDSSRYVHINMPNTSLASSSFSVGQTTKDIIHGAFRCEKSVFDYLRVHPPAIKYLKPRGIGSYYFPFQFTPDQSGCRSCGSDKNSPCICWDEHKGCNILYFAIQILVILKLVCSDKEYQSWVEICQKRGIHHLMVAFIKKRNVFSARLNRNAEVTKYTTTMINLSENWKSPRSSYNIRYQNIGLTPKQITTFYNKTWMQLRNRNDNILVYFISGRHEKASAFWLYQASFDYVWRLCKIPFLNIKASFVTDYEGDDAYLYSVLGTDRFSVMGSYVNTDKSDREAMSGTSEDIFTISYLQWFYMQFALFHNKDFMDKLKLYFPGLPKFTFFYQWLHFQKFFVHCGNNVWVRIYWYYPYILNRLMKKAT